LNNILISLEDSLESVADVETANFGIELEELLQGINVSTVLLEDFIIKSLSEQSTFSPAMKAGIIRVLLILPLIEKLIWGKKARDEKEYAKLIPSDWKGKK